MVDRCVLSLVNNLKFNPLLEISISARFSSRQAISRCDTHLEYRISTLPILMTPSQFSTVFHFIFVMQSQKRLNYNSVRSIAKQTRTLIGPRREWHEFAIDKFVQKFAIEIRKLCDNFFPKTQCSAVQRRSVAINKHT